jgi:hypothetical protein
MIRLLTVELLKGRMTMMRLKVEKIGQGLHPSEFVVSVRTKEGSEEIILDPRTISNDTLSIGWPVGADRDYRLVELPRPTSRGAKRVWVNKDDLIPDEVARVPA